MGDKLLDMVNSWAEEYGVLKSGTLIVAGVSGGADSVCLLDILHRLGKTKGFSVVAVHVNHMLRGLEADEDENFVRELCNRYGIPLKVFREDVAAYAEKNSCSVEEAGRIVRYSSMEKVLKEQGAAYIAVAHHRDDQAETVFLNILRGTGLDGLCGMSDINGRIIRPLLRAGRSEIMEYIERNGLSFRTDSSNYENIYLRNVIRNVIFPEIKNRTGTDISARLVRMQELLRADRDFLNLFAEKEFNDILVLENDEKVVLKRDKLKKIHPAVSGRIIRIAWERVSGSLRRLESVHVNSILNIISKDGNRTAELPQGIKVIAEYDRVEFSAESKREKAELPVYKISVPSVAEFPGFNIRVETEIFTRNEYVEKFGRIKKTKENSLIQLFDYDKIKEGIYIRVRMPGDVFHPYNSSGKKKLKEFFIDQKIPKNIRGNIPLLADGKNIIWVVGYRTADNYKIDDSTETILYVNITLHENKTFKK